MPTPAQYINRIEFVNRVIKMRIDGLSHEDSMKQLSFPANCMNWNIGHIVVFRDVYLGAIDGVTKPDPAEYAIYGAGSPPLTDSANAVHLDTLIEKLDESTERAKKIFQAMPAEQLDEPYDWFAEPKRLDDYLHFYVVVHEAIHLGQLEILRELALA